MPKSSCLESGFNPLRTFLAAPVIALACSLVLGCGESLAQSKNAQELQDDAPAKLERPAEIGKIEDAFSGPFKSEALEFVASTNGYNTHLEKSFLRERVDTRLPHWRTAAEKGDPIAQFFMGLCDFHGFGVTKSGADVFRWYRSSANQSNPLALYGLHYFYRAGNFGAEKDDETAFQLAQKSAMAGYTPAQVRVGLSYAYGWGTPISETKAARWFREAATRGDVLGQEGLAFFYLYGKGVQQDNNEALLWYTRASEQGSSKASRILGSVFALGGLGQERNLPEAYAYFRESARLGDKLADEYESDFSKDFTLRVLKILQSQPEMRPIPRTLATPLEQALYIAAHPRVEVLRTQLIGEWHYQTHPDNFKHQVDPATRRLVTAQFTDDGQYSITEAISNVDQPDKVEKHVETGKWSWSWSRQSLVGYGTIVHHAEGKELSRESTVRDFTCGSDAMWLRVYDQDAPKNYGFRFSEFRLGRTSESTARVKKLLASLTDEKPSLSEELLGTWYCKELDHNREVSFVRFNSDHSSVKGAAPRNSTADQVKSRGGGSGSWSINRMAITRSSVGWRIVEKKRMRSSYIAPGGEIINESYFEEGGVSKQYIPVGKELRDSDGTIFHRLP